MVFSSAQAASLHTLFETLSYFVGYAYYKHLRKSGDAISTDNRIYIIMGAAAGALVFSRLIGLLEDPNLFTAAHPFIYYLQHKTILGGLAGGLLGVELTKKILGERNSSGDLFVFPIILSLVIGRVGCLLAGVHDGTVGTPTASIFGMDLGDGIKRHPTSLYEIIFLIVLFLILKIYNNKSKSSRVAEGGVAIQQSVDCFVRQSRPLNDASGYLFRYFMMSYAAFRLLIENIKPVYPIFGGFTAIQWTCVALLIYYAQLFIRRKAA